MRVGQEMFNAAAAFTPILTHKDQSFGNADLLTIAGLVRGGKVNVEINREFLQGLGADAMYFSDKVVGYDERICFELNGNTLYVRDLPRGSSYSRMILAHEAVHIRADLLKKNEFIWDHEELAYFVGGFIFAMLDPAAAKSAASVDNALLMGCLAAEYYRAHPEDVLISSEKFKRKIAFDFTKEGGIKGEVNPYKALEQVVQKLYPQGIKAGKKQESIFNGLW